ncbi:MarC family protein [Kangiella taiwanensis]|uniref:MarC family protein n=1 Tax=Kangiella taiwanensis TaxID=1079179 RepID=UPI001CC153B3|nr:MarC family protein [Kangiella taiwanensis]
MKDALILWATIDPIGTLAIFASLTATLTPKERFKTAVKAITYSAIILVGAVVIGQILLSAMGISLVSLQVAGGMILFIFSLQMIFGDALAFSSGGEKEKGHDIAVFPLAVPSIATPGAIMAAILLTDNHVYDIQTQVGTSLIMLGVLAVAFLFMLAASPILKVIGQNGAAILIRVMGLILAAMSLEFILEAFKIFEWLETFNQTS